jgi:hypothetical protein
MCGTAAGHKMAERRRCCWVCHRKAATLRTGAAAVGTAGCAAAASPAALPRVHSTGPHDPPPSLPTPHPLQHTHNVEGGAHVGRLDKVAAVKVDAEHINGRGAQQVALLLREAGQVVALGVAHDLWRGGGGVCVCVFGGGVQGWGGGAGTGVRWWARVSPSAPTVTEHAAATSHVSDAVQVMTSDTTSQTRVNLCVLP